MDKKRLEQDAKEYRTMLINGKVDIENARDMIQPYINIINKDREKISKAYNRYIPMLTFEEFIKKGIDICSN